MRMTSVAPMTSVSSVSSQPPLDAEGASAVCEVASRTRVQVAFDWARRARVPWWTPAMFALYTSLYFTICRDLNDPRLVALELDLHKPDEVYRWYTYSLVHGSVAHLGVNMMGWLIYGVLCEVDNGWWRTAAIQAGAVLGGAMAAGWEYRILQPRHLVVLGASGGVYGMMSSLIGNLALNWQELHLVKRIVYPMFLGCTIVSDVVVSAVLRSSTTSYSAHVGGFVFGALGGLCIMRNEIVRSWEVRMRKAAGAAWLVLIFVGAVNLGTL